MIEAWKRLPLIALSLAALSGAARSEQPLMHDAYVWQRVWSPAVVAAIAQSSDLVRDWRVLAAESDDAGRLQPTEIDRLALAASGRPVILVVRIDGQLANWDEGTLLANLDTLLGRWRSSGVPITGLEIDHDCATARLPAYAHFLAALRSRLAPDLRLSLTMLPTWLDSPELEAVLAPTDEIVLQVHAIQNPRAGLFDPATAHRWVDGLTRRSSKPFRVSVPTYGARVSWGADGSLLAVESEAPLLAGGESARELTVSPRDVAAFLSGLKRNPPAHFLGVAWFRLPVETDRRAWSLATWRAVVTGSPAQDRVAVQIENGDTPGVSHLMLINPGSLDANLPARIELPAACAIGDGINGYALGHGLSGLKFERQQVGMLPGHARQTIGWMRCAPKQEDIHVAF
jgi:hypothetical protein